MEIDSPRQTHCTGIDKEDQGEKFKTAATSNRNPDKNRERETRITLLGQDVNRTANFSWSRIHVGPDPS